MASVTPAMPPPMMATWKSFLEGDIMCGVIWGRGFNDGLRWELK